MDYLMLLSEVGELSSVDKVRTYLKKLEDFSSSNPSKKTDFSNAFCFDRNKKQTNKRLKADSDADKDEDVLPHPEKVVNHPVNIESQNQEQQAKTGGGPSNEPSPVAGATAVTPGSATAGGVPGRKRCKCKRSRCLKFYCECFAANQFCVEGDCICKDCWNTNYSWHAQAREDAIMLALEKRPDAFSDRFEAVPARLACHCKKSNCLKKYCDCYAAGRYCSELCGCVACLNNEAYFKEKQVIKDQMAAGEGSGPNPSPSASPPSASPPAASNKSRHPQQQQSPVQMTSSPGGVIPPLPFRAGSPPSRPGGGNLIQTASPGQRQAPAPHSLIHSSSPPPPGQQYANAAVFVGSNGMPTMMATGNMATPVAMMASGQFAARGMGVPGGSSGMLATALQHQAMMMMSQNAVNSSSMAAPMGNISRTPTPNMPQQHQPSSSPMQSMQHMVNRVATPNMPHQASTSPMQPMQQQQMVNRAPTPTNMVMMANPSTIGTSPGQAVVQTSPSPSPPPTVTNPATNNNIT